PPWCPIPAADGRDPFAVLLLFEQRETSSGRVVGDCWLARQVVGQRAERDKRRRRRSGGVDSKTPILIRQLHPSTLAILRASCTRPHRNVIRLDWIATVDIPRGPKRFTGFPRPTHGFSPASSQC